MSYATSSSSLRNSSARGPMRSSSNGLQRSSSTASNSSTGDMSGGGNPALRRQATTDLSYANLDNDEDFERILASYDIVLVVDVLRKYLAMEVQSSLAGTASSKQQSAQIKRKFYERFNQILDRLFGNDEVSKAKYGGWLDYSVGLASATSAGALPNAALRKKKLSSANLLGGSSLSREQEDALRMESYIDSLTASGRALTEFLGFLKEDEAGSMFQLLFKMTHPVEFKLEMDLLPEQSKMALLSRSAFTSALFTQLLQKPITKQRIDPRNPVLLVSIKELYLFYFMRHPACANHQSSPATSEAAANSGEQAAKQRAASIMGSLSDTFAARPKRKENYSWRAFYNDGVASLTRGNPYNVLLLQYLKLFFPDSGKPVQSRFLGKLLQHSNLFLHILIEFWLRQNLIVFSDDVPSAAAGGAATAASSSMDYSGYRMQQKLVSPMATVLTQTTYMAPSDDLLSSLLLTIIHLLSDSFYPAPLDPSSSSSPSTTSISALAASSMLIGSGGGYLSPSVSVLRRPLYEFLRLVFSRAPIGLSPTAFLAIADVWLAYLQPWNCKQWAKDASPSSSSGMRRAASDTTSSEPSSQGSAQGSSSQHSPVYTPAWETYVLANYHFYTSLLGAFIERAKELDFTGGNDERALVILDRTLSVFTPELLSLLRSSSDFLDKHQPYSIASSSLASSSSLMQISSRVNKATSNTTSSSGNSTNATANGASGGSGSGSVVDVALSPRQGQILTFHCKALGVECIGVPLHTSFHRDAERVFDKLWSDAGFLSGTADSSAIPPQRSPKSPSSSSNTASWFTQPKETPFERVHRLSRALRRVFEISDAYVASTAHSRSLPTGNGGLEPLEPSRHSKLRHLLTQQGITQLRQGLRLCSPDEITYIGDPMVRPICSFEIGALVKLSFHLSTWLNRHFGLRSAYKGKYFQDNVDVDPATRFTSFRFNLRFLASKPNLVFLTVFMWLLYFVLLW